MKRTLIVMAATLAFAEVARADFDPVALTPDSFTADVIVEKTAPKAFNDYVTATMDGGTNNNAWVWYEQGFDTSRPTTGIPPAGSTFTAPADANRSYQMAPSYAADNVLCIYSAIPIGTLTVTSPTAFAVLSVLNAGGGGASTIDYTVHYQGGGIQTGSLTVNDWFDQTPTEVAAVSNGRVNTDNGQLGNTYGNAPRIFYGDIYLSDAVNPVASIDFSSSSGNRAAIFGLSGSADGVVYSPIAVTGFNRDMVIEAGVIPSGCLYTKSTATMEGGSTNNTGNTFYEVGFNTGAPTTGLPAQGTSITNGTPEHVFTMPADYAVNNVVYLGNYEGYTTATLTLTTPAAFTSLSFLNCAGNGPVTINVTVYYQDASTENFSFSALDWFNQTPVFYTMNGRFRPDTLALNNVNSGNPRLYANDITLGNTTSPVTRIDFSYGSGGRAAIFAVAGQTTGGGNFSPVAVTGYNADAVVEASAVRYPAALYTATTASMDGGTNNTGATWYEQGYYAAMPDSGLPAPGTVISSATQPDHHYQLPATYTGNNAVYVDYAHAEANLTLATPASYSALSFLSATANDSVTNEVVMQYADGTQETNTFVSRDWFNNTPFAFTSQGRVNLNTRTINNDPGHNLNQNPRLYEAQFALGNTVSPVTNVILRFLGAVNPTTGRMVVLAVSATAGAVQPIIASISPSTVPLVMEGSNIVFSAGVTGGTEPITYQWQIGTNDVFVDLADGGKISGAMTPSLTIASVGWTNTAQYRMVATNAAGFGISPIATIPRVLSGLPDVTQPTDPIVVYQPNGGGTPPANENVEKSIDNTTSKYLNRGSGTTPFSGPGGFVVTPSIGGTIVEALRFYTANDAEGRDPAAYAFEGSRDGGATFTPITTGTLAMPSGRNAGALALNPLTQNIQEVHFANTQGYTTYRLSISTVKGNESLMQFGEVELLGVVDPNSGPTILLAPADTTVNEGATATFSVTAVGPGTLSYAWYDVSAGDPGTAVGGNSPTLTLDSVAAAMDGNTYRVVVNNAFGSVTSPGLAQPGARLNVNSGPPIVLEDIPFQALAYVGRTLVLPVMISGTEPFDLQWQKDSSNLSDTDRVLGSQSNVLSITDARVADSGNYQLATIHNSQGDAQSTIQALTVQKIPAFTPSGEGWALNGNPTVPVIQSEVLTLTYGSGSSAASAWYPARLYIGAFKASFVYQDVNTGGADGTALVLQNDPRGTAALGGAGGGLGYSGITPSAALQLNIYNSSGIAFNVNGATGGYTPTAPVDLRNGNLIRVELTYAAGVAHVTLTDTVTSSTFSADLPVGSLPAQVGADTAYVGFTGADGGVASFQNVSDFSFIPMPTLSARSVGGAVVLAWPASIGGYTIQSADSLTSPVWTDETLTVTLVGDEYQATVAAPTSSKIYRLVLVP